MRDFAELTEHERVGRYEQLARQALAEYGMGEASLAFRSYTENAVFEVGDVTSGTHASLRICRSSWDADALAREIHWLESLGRAGDLRIPEPIMTLADEPYCIVEQEGIPGARACVLFTWVPGDYAEPAELTPTRMRRVGGFLATLHDHAETFYMPPELPMNRFGAAALADENHRQNIATYFEDDEDLVWFDRAVEGTIDVMRELGDGSTVAGIIHGDFHQRNYVFDGSDIGALDFETLLWGYYLYDLATTLSYLVPEFLGDVDPAPLRAAVCEGYASRRSLSGDVERILRIFSAYRVWVMADWSSGSPRMLEHDWARRRLDAMPKQIEALLGDG